MSPAPIFAYVEHCLPGETVEVRARAATRLGLALEIANRGDLDLAPLRESGAVVATLQAYRMHVVHPLHRDAARRADGARHLRETIELAADAGVPRVLAVCGYGDQICDDPFESCLEFFAAVAPLAAERSVRLVIEPLSRSRAAAMSGPEEIQRLLDALARPSVFALAIDTGHLLDDGLDPAAVLALCRHPVEEIQLRGPGSRPPAPDVPLKAWLAALRLPPAVIAVEHRDPIDPADLEALVARLREHAGA